MIGQISRSHFGTCAENGKINFGLVMIGNTIVASSATPARNRIFRCTLGSRSVETGNPKIVPGADCGILRAMSSIGPGRFCCGAPYGFCACG
jgi:hypothetical protein